MSQTSAAIRHSGLPQPWAAVPLTVVMPTYNEIGALAGTCERVLSLPLSRLHLKIVDDNSPDGTGQLADELARAQPRVRVLHREQKQGLGKAYLHAFQWALDRGYSFVVEMDADFSHDPKYLPHLLDEAQAGADLVLGSRYVSGGGTVNWGVGRKILSRGGSLYARTILGIRIRDLTGGFKCFNRRVLEAIDLPTVQSSGYAFQIELTYRTLKKGFTVREVPIVFEDRRVGQSKMSRKIFLEGLTMVWKLRLGH